jgi:hypothetical protein
MYGVLILDFPQLRETQETYKSLVLHEVDVMNPQLKRPAVEMYAVANGDGEGGLTFWGASPASGTGRGS